MDLDGMSLVGWLGGKKVYVRKKNKLIVWNSYSKAEDAR